MLETTLCYIERDGAYLMLHRVKKENDLNRDKWIGVGGKFEPGETLSLIHIFSVSFLESPAFSAAALMSSALFTMGSSFKINNG